MLRFPKVTSTPQLTLSTEPTTLSQLTLSARNGKVTAQILRPSCVHLLSVYLLCTAAAAALQPPAENNFY